MPDNSICYILGSGPSIKKQDLSVLKNKTVFCANWFINHNDIKNLNVNFYTAYDPAFVTPAVNQEWLRKIQRLENCIYFFPESWREMINIKNTEWVTTDFDNKVYEDKEFHWNSQKGFYDGGTVIINMCIPLAIEMGFKQIFLLGCDCSYGITQNKGLSSAYFYDMAHHKTEMKHDSNSEKIWQKNIMKSYQKVKKIIDRTDIEIFNATEGGELEVFERKSLAESIK